MSAERRHAIGSTPPCCARFADYSLRSSRFRFWRRDRHAGLAGYESPLPAVPQNSEDAIGRGTRLRRSSWNNVAGRPLSPGPFPFTLVDSAGAPATTTGVMNLHMLKRTEARLPLCLAQAISCDRAMGGGSVQTILTIPTLRLGIR